MQMLLVSFQYMTLFSNSTILLIFIPVPKGNASSKKKVSLAILDSYRSLVIPRSKTKGKTKYSSQTFLSV